MIRAILDANVWISFLLGAKERGTIDRVTTAVFRSNVELLVPQELIEELRSVFRNSSYLSTRIPNANLEALVEQFYTSATVLPLLPQNKRYSRDPKDDYLIAYSLVHSVDYLVTGDRDLLAMKKVAHIQIIEPSKFVEIVD